MRKHYTDIISIFFQHVVCCVFLLESFYRGDSSAYTHYTTFKKKIILNYSKSAAMGLFLRDSRTSNKQPW